MLLGIDIGNTNISLAVMKGQQVKEKFQVRTHLKRKDIEAKIKNVFHKVQKDYESCPKVVICSVVPEATKIVKEIIGKFLGRGERPFAPTIVIGQDVIVPMKNLYKNPKQVGQDRLVGAYAAKILYGAPCIVIDLGTASTFDVISKKGAYLGGIILPGFRLATEALFEKTALLPNVVVGANGRSPLRMAKNRSPLIGTTTHESISSGVIFGNQVMIEGLVQMISRKIKAKPKVIVTGGNMVFLKKVLSAKKYCFDEDLIFKGLSLLVK